MGDMKVAIQGLKGSFHHQAAQQLLPHQTLELVECDSFHDVFKLVSSGQVDAGVSAIENSFHGSINPVYRLFERHKVWIGAEVTLQIEQLLIGTAMLPTEQFNQADTIVYSQAPALAQCELWLDKHLPLAQRVETHDTAASVKMVVEQGNTNHVAIAGQTAADTYGGTVIAGPINDDKHNYTRFVLLLPKPAEDDQANRTSIILTSDHTPGALYRALGIFAKHEVNLSKLDSHPIVGDKRHYAFYIDFDAGYRSDRGRQVIQELENNGCSVRILGSYHTEA